jgi:hypothetical protein
VGERLDVLLRLLVQIGDGDLCAECPKGLGASPGDRILVGNANNETSLIFQQFGSRCGNHGRFPIATHVVQIAIGSLVEVAECRTPILRGVDFRDFSAIDLELTVAPGSDFDFKLVTPAPSQRNVEGWRLFRSRLSRWSSSSPFDTHLLDLDLQHTSLTGS